MSNYLGLDISTSYVGWCVVDDSGTLVKMGYIEILKIKSVFEKASAVKNRLEELQKRFPISGIFIEENLQAFRPGLSSAKTLITLSRFNGIVSYLCEQIFRMEPSFMNVNAARKIVGLKIIRKSKGGKPTKHQVLEWVSSELAEEPYPWPVKTLKSGPRKGMIIVQDGCYDMADAFVIARSGVLSQC
jgi:Holliday junction resolvasome RuvABC endonuclease subunit